MSYSAEFRLVAACCIWPPSPRRDDAIAAAASAGIAWAKVLEIAQRQRVEGLVADGLRRSRGAATTSIKSALESRASAIARLSLLQAAESVRLQRLFEAAGIGLTFIKGTALALLAYGNIGIKHSWDIDILVERADILAASALLRGAGYIRESPDETLDPERFLEWSFVANECIWRDPARDIFVELHWRLSQNASQLARASSSQYVAIAEGLVLRTLGDDDLFVYLCLHGARHAWSRLKWLADLAAWLSQKSPQDVERLYRRAETSGVGRASAQALLLCNQLLDLPLAPGFADGLRRNAINRLLIAIALRSMAGAGGTRQIDDRWTGNLAIHLSHFLLAPGPRIWWEELRSKAIGWTDFRWIRLPRPLYFLYPLMRIPSWLWRRIAHLLARS